MNEVSRVVMFASFLAVFSIVGCQQLPDSRGGEGDAMADAAIRKQIVDTLQTQARAWTDNDLDGFMIGFHRSPDLCFAHPKGITLGYETVRGWYSQSIENSDLRFTDLDVTVLSPDAAVVFGQFHNTMKDGNYATGLFTLLMRKIDGRWVVVHDHSSDLPADWAADSP
ncbi:MAG: nuclear transport factor 2 family protein [Rhodospirillales bacterium]|nr:nuclear transport factor 2 family protein [Rhodospirillales bacterium]